MSIPSVIIDD